ncbi:MAG: phosphoesterase PA-phosphatase related protein [Parcubacteria group bacterium]|nr:phosphoesterase PA-phosphatase related protein [Parcubacteria group bacterium]
MKVFFLEFISDFFSIFRGRNLFWHGLAILLTYIILMSGFDWWYSLHTRIPILRPLSVPALVLGGLLPILVPAALLALSRFRGSEALLRPGFVLAKAALLGSMISSLYKALTGRIQPDTFSSIDVSHSFQFGFLKHGIFWGWPSSHTTIAFSMAVALIYLYPKAWVKWLALIYAFYVAVAVSTGIHWFSEAVAGAIIGSVIGVVVGRRA